MEILNLNKEIKEKSKLTLGQLQKAISYNQYVEIYSCDIALDYNHNFRDHAYKIINEKLIFKGYDYDSKKSFNQYHYIKDIDGQHNMWYYDDRIVFQVCTTMEGNLKIFVLN